MTFLEIARRWTIVILAETLRISASAVEAVLPFHPRWLAQIALLASQLRASADGNEEWSAAGDDLGTDGLPSMEALLASHTRLRQALSDIVARGLALDDKLLERMRSDWSQDSIVSYVTSAETTLRDGATTALEEAAEPLGMSVAAMAALAGAGADVVETVQITSKPTVKRAVTPAKRPESVR